MHIDSAAVGETNPNSQKSKITHVEHSRKAQFSTFFANENNTKKITNNVERLKNSKKAKGNIELVKKAPHKMQQTKFSHRHAKPYS